MKKTILLSICIVLMSALVSSVEAYKFVKTYNDSTESIMASYNSNTKSKVLGYYIIANGAGTMNVQWDGKIDEWYLLENNRTTLKYKVNARDITNPLDITHLWVTVTYNKKTTLVSLVTDTSFAIAWI